jgi:hypothetical protein
VTKYPIQDIKTKKWPKIDESVFSAELLPETTFIGTCWVGDDMLKEIAMTEKEIQLKSEVDFDPYIFYRCTRKLKDGKQLPKINLTDYFPLSDNSGVSLEIIPDVSLMKNESIINKNPELFEEIKQTILNFPANLESELKSTLEKHIKNNNLDMDSLIDLSQLTFTSPDLIQMDPRTLNLKVQALQSLNKHFMSIINYIILDLESIEWIKKEIESGGMSDSLAHSFMNARELAFSSVKDRFINDIVKGMRSAAGRKLMKIAVDRSRAREWSEEGKVDHKGEGSIFGQVWT